MIELISSLFKEGDFIRLFFNNSSRIVEGTILKILPSSIAIKSVDGKICGVKGDDIDSFDSSSTPTSVTEISHNEATVIPSSTTGGTPHNDTPSPKNTSQKSEEVKEEPKPVCQAPKQELKPGDVIPLEELQRRMGAKPRIQREKKKLTSLGSDFNALSTLVEEDHAKENQKIVPALGSIKWLSADGRPFGCILDGKDNIELYFSFSQVVDPHLLKTIRRGASVIYTKAIEALGPKAKIIHSPGKISDLLDLAKDLVKSGDEKFAIGVLEHILNEYPDNFDAEKLLKELGGKVSYRIIPNKQTSSTELYQKAKRLHDSKKYDEAIDAYKEAIKANHKRESAVKDLGMLYLFLCNQAESEEKKEYYRLEAIDFMEENSKYLPQNTVTWSYMETFYYSVREFEKFDHVTDKLLANKQVQSEGQRYVFLLNKKAASYLRRGNKDRAKDYIERSLEVSPEGSAALKLLSIIENDNVDIETVFNATEFESLTVGLSPFIQQTLADYDEYLGVKEKIIDTENFKKRTLRSIRHLIETTIGRSKERAKYILTEVKLMQDIEPDESKLRSELARYCNDMAKSSMFDQRSPDVIRFYYYEAFSLEDRIDQTLRQVILFLSSFYMPHRELLNSRANTVEKDELEKEFDSSLGRAIKQTFFWDELLNMLIVNREITSYISEKLFSTSKYKLESINYLKSIDIDVNGSDRGSFAKAWDRARDSRKIAYNRLLAFIKSWGNYTNLDECITNIRQIEFDKSSERCLCALDKKRINIIKVNVIPAIESYINTSGYRNKEVNRNNANGQLAQLVEDIQDNPTKISYEGLLPFLKVLSSLLEDSFNEVIKTSEPRVDLRLLSEETVVDEDNLVSIQVSVSNHKDSSPIREVSVVIQDMPGIFFIADNNVSYNAIDGGELSIFKLKLKIDDEIRRLKATPLKATCKYRSGSGMMEKSYDLSLKLYSPSDFSEIDNPYSPIADGGPVPVTSNMFYGRDGFISDVAKSILNSPSKQIIIYGQKRCGKSSVMLHLKEKLMETNRMFCIFFSMGDIINNLSEASFYHKILSSIKTELEFIEFDGGIIPEFEIPSYADFKNEDEDNPLNTFTKYMIKFKLSCKKTDGWQDKNLVVMIDEFTYLYTEIKKGNISPSIMKQWKAVTQNERAQFSVVLVGQDVVPSFKKEEYASNAFGVIQDIRLTYLEEQPARELIEKPILDTNGESRYIGNAVTRILEYTSRNPYYIQIFCARLVDFMNKNKSIKVTEADVNEVAHSFVVGDQALEIDKFDNLIRAGESEDLQEVPEAEIIAVLRQIAMGTKNITYCKRADISTDYGEEEENRVLQHLEDREVLEKKGDDNYKIQVKLFQEWLLNH